MKYYEALVFVRIQGRVHLTDAQLDARKAMLKALDAKEHGENRFATTQAIGFKPGEIFGFDGTLNPKEATLLDCKPAQFERRVLEQRQAAAEAKAATLKGRADREAAIRRAKEKKDKEAEARRAAAEKARAMAAREARERAEAAGQLGGQD